MRPSLKRFSRFFAVLSIVLAGLTLATVFQNCSGMVADQNALYYSTATSTCAGISCEQDMQYVKIRISSGGFYVEAKPSYTPSSCEGSNCFDVAGTCDNGGYPGTKFYYQWVLDPAGVQTEVDPNTSCDAMGRFRFVAKVPLSVYDYTKTNSIRVYMKVIDDGGNILENPVGDSEITLPVVTRN